MNDYTDYQDAYDAAQHRASTSGLDVAIRKVTWYGRTRYTVAYASRNDSDDATAEIVRATDPKIRRA